MPTRKAQIIAGLPEDDEPTVQTCYVCKEPVSGYCRLDTPDAEGQRRQVVLGYRHTACVPPEAALGGTSRKTMLGTGR